MLALGVVDIDDGEDNPVCHREHHNNGTYDVASLDGLLGGQGSVENEVVQLAEKLLKLVRKQDDDHLEEAKDGAVEHFLRVATCAGYHGLVIS